MLMKLVITDIADFKHKSNEEIQVVSAQDKNIVSCTGCFNCWLKTPGECQIRDGYSSVAARIGKCDEMIIVSRCFYGSTSPFVKNVLDRSIACVSPDFRFDNGRMKHKRRYFNSWRIKAVFYGENITEAEKSTARKIISATAQNFSADGCEVIFCGSVQAAEEVCL